MSISSIRLKILTPTRILIDQQVAKITAEGVHGSFQLLPQHVDFLAALVPGILSFEDQDGHEEFLAVDEGMLIKRRDEVLVSCRQATRGANLELLREKVAEEFEKLDDREKVAHAATAKLEAAFLRSYLDLAEESL